LQVAYGRSHPVPLSCLASKKFIRRSCMSLTVLIVYFTVSVAVLVRFETDWTIIDGIYFTMATMSTVGYGDLYPSPDNGMRPFAIIMIFVGIGLVFPVGGWLICAFLDPITAKGRWLLDKFFPPEYIDIDGDGGNDYPVPAAAPIFYLKKVVPSLMLIFVLQIVSAFIFVALEPTWTFGDAIYHCIVTVSTVGYGDQKIYTQSGRLFSSFHMLVGVAMVSELLTTIDEVRTERQLSQQRIKAIRQELTKPMLEKLTTELTALRPDDDDPDNITEMEFVLAMLLECGFADRLTVMPFFAKFRALDATGDGMIGGDDVEASQKGKVRRTKTTVLKNRFAAPSASQLVKRVTPSRPSARSPGSPGSKYAMPAGKMKTAVVQPVPMEAAPDVGVQSRVGAPSQEGIQSRVGAPSQEEPSQES